MVMYKELWGEWRRSECQAGEDRVISLPCWRPPAYELVFSLYAAGVVVMDADVSRSVGEVHLKVHFSLPSFKILIIYTTIVKILLKKQLAALQKVANYIGYIIHFKTVSCGALIWLAKLIFSI